MSDADKTGASSDQARLRATRRAVIKGVIASGVAVSAVGYVVYERSATRPAAGSVERLVTLNVNGRDRRVDVSPHETLAHTIRYKLGLTGTKLSCDRSECGACTVMLDGVTDLFLLDPDAQRPRPQDHHHRRHRRSQWRAAQGAEGHDRRTGTAMRLLHLGPGGRGGGAAQSQSQTDAGRSAARHVRQSLQVRRLRSLSQSRHARVAEA